SDASDPSGASGVVDHAGQVITYSIVVSNTGNEDLTGVTVVDSLTGHTLNVGNLAVGSSTTVTDSYSNSAVEQSHIDDGTTIVNTATASSTQTGSVSSTVSTPVDQDPALSVVKTYTTPPTGSDGPSGASVVVDHACLFNTYSIVVSQPSFPTRRSSDLVDSLTGHTLNVGNLAVG